MDRLVALSSAEASIRTHQAYEQENRWLGFGRMTWNKENNEKWAKKYLENKNSKSGVLFFDTEIWAPDWNCVYKTGVPPDLFIRLYNEHGSRVAGEGLIVAIKKGIAEKNAEEIRAVISDISGMVPDSTVNSAVRSWFPGSGFVNRIEDMNPHEIKMIVEGKVPPPLAHRLQSILRGK